jgi:hypothetical protein
LAGDGRLKISTVTVRIRLGAPMPYKNTEKHKKAKHDWYVKNQELTKQRTKKSHKEYLERNQNFIRELKGQNPCTDCRKYYPWYVMDFDHLRDKKYDLKFMVHHAYSLEAIKKEIDKCELVCSNCHR